MPFKSKALEANIASYQVVVTIDPKYAVLQEVMAKYYGLMEGLTTFLKELSHPYKNWSFIIKEARLYSLDYFHLLKKHPRGPEAAALFVEIFSQAIEAVDDIEAQTDAVDNFLLFLQKVISDSGEHINRFIPPLNGAFDYITTAESEHFQLFLKSFYQIKKIVAALLVYPSDMIGDYRSVHALVLKYYGDGYAYWLDQSDPYHWFETRAEKAVENEAMHEIFNSITHANIAAQQERLCHIAGDGQLSSRELLQRLLALPGYQEIVERYRKVPQALMAAGAPLKMGRQWKVLFLFHMMNISGLAAIHEEALRDINRTLSWLIENTTDHNIRQLIDKTFTILKARTVEYPITALNCVLTMGKGVYKTAESDLVNYFIEQVLDLGFQAPLISGVGDDWQIRANSAHLENIRTWLELIKLNPKWSQRLLSGLIIHLSLYGVFIKDTDLFPQDITELLNSDIGPVYNLCKQLTRIFPAYFNDIGAEGELRDVSTRIDEISHRKDNLIHFLRKQSHVESSNRILHFMEAALEFWQSKDKSGVEPYVPPNIYERIETSGPYIDGVHRIMTHLAKAGMTMPQQLLTVERSQLKQRIDQVPKTLPEDKERAELVAIFYKLLHHKYSLDYTRLDAFVEALQTEIFPHLDDLKTALSQTEIKPKLAGLLAYLARLKELIISDNVYEISANIYKKRHFTVDIPSMYGSYHEMKFDALGLTFRIESLVNVLFEEVVETIDLSLITKATMHQIHDRLMLFDQALKIDGMTSVEFERQLELLSHSLEVKGFTFTQYLDIFKGFTQAVKNIINDHFNNIHEDNLNRIQLNRPLEQLLPKFLPVNGPIEPEKIHHRVSEVFFIDRIALSLGLQQLDRFLTRIVNILFHQSKTLFPDQLRMLLLYDPQRAMIPIGKEDKLVKGVIDLGNKGANLDKLKRYGLPVPPGFIVTTEVFRCREIIDSYPPAELNFTEQIIGQIKTLEKVTGKTFGDSRKPMLLSVRSGASISQPGMMDTFLNVGLNEDIAEGLASIAGNAWFAWDNYRRFLQCFGMAVGIDRDDFDWIIRGFKERLSLPFKREFSGEQMKSVALTYKQYIKDSGFEILENPFDQLFWSIKSVLNSWESEKAKAYRKIMGISHDWGTAVTVQSMVYGNLSSRSGSGVIFTHNPRWSGDSIRLWGDFTIGNQGEDVVSGLVNTLPISITQQEIEMRETDITLETHFQGIYTALKKQVLYLIEVKGWSPQEIEFTFEKPSVDGLYILQSRDMAMRERQKVATFDPEGVSMTRFIGHGIGVSGGAMSGRVVFDLEEIDHLRRAEPQTSLILLRSDTVPDDIREIYASDGLLTARGGLTSHAAVVAHRLEKTCVVGCDTLFCDEKAKECRVNQLVLRPGDFISIDGREGSVYRGKIKINVAGST